MAETSRRRRDDERGIAKSSGRNHEQREQSATLLSTLQARHARTNSDI